jgi:hypothetical protein
MVDEEQYRRTYQEVITAPCPFEKAILQRVCACPRATKCHIAEREAVNCQSPQAQETCVAFLHHVRKRANFALGLKRMPGALPHAKAIKIQCGGLLGLQNALDPFAQESRVSDVHGLMNRAIKRFQEMSNIPYDQIVREVNKYKGRQSPRRGRSDSGQQDE